MAGARKHHYVPQSFLAGFTSDGTKDGRLLVRDLGTGRRWWSGPKGAGHRRDFYTIDLEGHDPLEVENAFQAIEDAAAPDLRRIINAKAPPPLASAPNVLPLIASLVIRVPTSRRAIEDASRHVVRTAFPRALSALPKPPRSIRSMVFGHLPTGTEPPSEKYEAALLNLFEDEVRIDIDQTWSIAHMLSRFELVLTSLTGLFWTVAVSPAGTPDFVCSDNPVSFRGDHALARSGVSVAVALSRRVAAVGSLMEPENPLIHADARFVGIVNGLTIMSADRYVFSATEDLYWVQNGGAPGRISDLPSRTTEE